MNWNAFLVGVAMLWPLWLTAAVLGLLLIACRWSPADDDEPAVSHELREVSLAASGWTETIPSLPKHPLGWSVDSVESGVVPGCLVPIATAPDGRQHRYCTRDGSWTGLATEREQAAAAKALEATQPGPGWTVRRIRGSHVAVNSDGDAAWWAHDRCQWVPLHPNEPLAREAFAEAFPDEAVPESWKKSAGELLAVLAAAREERQVELARAMQAQARQVLHPPMWRPWWDKGQAASYGYGQVKSWPPREFVFHEPNPAVHAG